MAYTSCYYVSHTTLPILVTDRNKNKAKGPFIDFCLLIKQKYTIKLYNAKSVGNDCYSIIETK